MLKPILILASILAVICALALYLRRYDNDATWREVLTNKPRKRR